MRAVDTNVLVYSEIISSPHHRIARSALTRLAEHGVSELVTGDRDFSRFPIRVFNPFVEGAEP